MGFSDFLPSPGSSLDPKRIATRLASDRAIRAWLDENGNGETPLDSFRLGGCWFFAEVLIGASAGALQLYGLGYALDLEDREEGTYEHVVTYDPVTDRYLDVDGSHTKAALLKDWAVKPQWRSMMGDAVLEPFDRERNVSIPWPDPKLVTRGIKIAKKPS
jgi:hypothetical protein